MGERNRKRNGGMGGMPVLKEVAAIRTFETSKTRPVPRWLAWSINFSLQRRQLAGSSSLLFRRTVESAWAIRALQRPRTVQAVFTVRLNSYSSGPRTGNLRTEFLT